MFANPAPSQNLKATSDFYQFFGLVSRLSCSHLFVVWFRVCQKGFELTGWKKIHRSDWNVSGESHASWDKVQRNVGNLDILFFFFWAVWLLLIWQLLFFPPVLFMTKYRYVFLPFFKLSLSTCLSLSNPWPSSVFFTHKQKSIWSIVFTWKAASGYYTGLSFFSLSFWGKTVEEHHKSISHNIQYLFITVHICFGVHEIVWWHITNGTMATSLLFPGSLWSSPSNMSSGGYRACLWVSFLRGKPCEWDVSTVKLQHVSSHSASRPWASEKTQAWMAKTNQPACPCLSPARGVLIKITDDSAV